MRLLNLNRDSRYRTILILLFFMAVALVIRIIPLLFANDGGLMSLRDTDSWFTLRQVEVMVHHFPQYNWFDPMTAFPTGKIIDWGPLFPFIAAVLCLGAGATTQGAIVYISSWVAPLMAALMVPVMYFLGKTAWNRNTGFVAAGLITVASFALFILTIAGLVMHHIGETLFSSLFLLVYLYYLASVKSNLPDLKNIKNLLVPLALASLAGVLYFLALITSTTTVLALIVIAIFTVIQSVIDHHSGRTPYRLLILNLVMLSVSALLLLLFGFKQSGVSVTSYTVGLVYLNLALIAETVVLVGLSLLLRGKTWHYLLSFGGLATGGFILMEIYPPFASIGLQAYTLLFGSSTFVSGVLNTEPLSLALAGTYFNVGLILAAGGFLVLGYHILKDRKAEWIFLLTWSVFMILITIQFQRFVYFSTVNIVLLSAICITEPFTWKRADGTSLSLRALASSFFPQFFTENTDRNHPPDKNACSQKPRKSGKPLKPSQNAENSVDFLKMLCLGGIIIMAIALVAVSMYQDINFGLNYPKEQIVPSPDWPDALNWLGTNTPSPGVDYFQQYNADFSYPAGAYGILATWEAGHWITFFSHRIPVTSPFQDHLSGGSGDYAFFLSNNESDANDIIQGLGGRYVITDSTLAIGNFADLALWADNSRDLSPYTTQFVVPDENDPSGVSKVYAFNDAYFRTMIVRLQNFDGSMQVPAKADYIQYKIQQVPEDDTTAAGTSARVVVNDQVVNMFQPNNTPIIEEGSTPQKGLYANVFSELPNSTVANVPALEHYRLVYESPNDATVQMLPGLVPIMPITLPGIKYVKIFEYVKGAHIPGNGLIEVPIKTNTGRVFDYSQQSQGGEFVVPYSMSGNPYDVVADRTLPYSRNRPLYQRH